MTHGRGVKRRLLLIAKHLRHRTRRAVETVLEVTRDIVEIAQEQMRVAKRVGLQVQQILARASDEVARAVRRLVAHLDRTTEPLDRSSPSTKPFSEVTVTSRTGL